MVSARVLVVDDEAPIRRALELAFRGVGYTVRAEPDGSELDKVTEEYRPDLAVVDVRLPVGPDGYAMARRLREQDIAVVLLTAADSLENRLTAFESGADDHVSKPFSTPELIARTQALLRRVGRLPDSVVTVGDVVIDNAARIVTRAGETIELTRTEYDLLSLLASRPNRVMTRGQLLVQLWGFDGYGSNVVDVHLSALRRKLEEHGPRLIHTVRGVGYVLRT